MYDVDTSGDTTSLQLIILMYISNLSTSSMHRVESDLHIYQRDVSCVYLMLYSRSFSVQVELEKHVVASMMVLLRCK